MPRLCLNMILACLLLVCADVSCSQERLMTIAFGSCAQQDRPQPIWDRIVEQNPDLFLFLGDNIYADTEDRSEMRAKYARLAAQPGYQRLLNACPVFATWDDHDYGVNDGGADYPMRVESQREFLRFFDEPRSSPRWHRPGVYDARIYGRVQVILLDTRYFRGPLKLASQEARAGRGPYAPNEDPGAGMLGEAQWKWLESQLRRPADLRILVSSIQVIPDEHGWEAWANFPRERDRLFSLIRSTDARGVVILSGDRHLAEISRLDSPNGVGYPLYDITSSSLNQPGGGRAEEPNQHRVGPGNFRRPNFGLIVIDWEQDDPPISLQIQDVQGQVVLRHDVRLSEIRPQ